MALYDHTPLLQLKWTHRRLVAAKVASVVELAASLEPVIEMERQAVERQPTSLKLAPALPPWSFCCNQICRRINAKAGERLTRLGVRLGLPCLPIAHNLRANG